MVPRAIGADDQPMDTDKAAWTAIQSALARVPLVRRRNVMGLPRVALRPNPALKVSQEPNSVRVWTRAAVTSG